jgi:hypothetical protein
MSDPAASSGSANALPAAGADADKNFSGNRVGSPSSSCPLKQKALTPQEAQQWFDHFKNDRSDIPFDYPVDCCYTRARAMANELQKKGVPVGKVWNYAHNFPNSGLSVATKNVPDGQVKWRYHVAPIVPVSQPDGTTQNMVIDPSMEAGPVTADKWKSDQNDPQSKLVQTSAEPYYRDPDGTVLRDPGDAEVDQTLAEHRAARAKLKGRGR